MTPKEVITAFSIDAFEISMILIGVFVAFIFYVAFSKNLPDMGHNFIIGFMMKRKKTYRCGDIFKIDGLEWYLDVMNGLRLKFKRVIDWDRSKDNIVLSKPEELSISYVTFLNMKIHKLGSCRI